MFKLTVHRVAWLSAVFWWDFLQETKVLPWKIPRAFVDVPFIQFAKSCTLLCLAIDGIIFCALMGDLTSTYFNYISPLESLKWRFPTMGIPQNGWFWYWQIRKWMMTGGSPHMWNLQIVLAPPRIFPADSQDAKGLHHNLCFRAIGFGDLKFRFLALARVKSGFDIPSDVYCKYIRTHTDIYIYIIRQCIFTRTIYIYTHWTKYVYIYICIYRIINL